MARTRAKPDPKLEAMLADHPGDAGSWQVYADSLLEAGEPWGEVIVGACTGKRVKKQQDAAEAELLRGIDNSSLTWRFGTIAVLWLNPEKRPAATKGDSAMVRALRRVLAHPAGRLVRVLMLGVPPSRDIGWDVDYSFDSIIPVIVKAGPLPLLHTIDMSQHAGHMPQDCRRRIGDLRKLWAAAPRLRELCLLGDLGHGGVPIALGAIKAPYLETFEFQSIGLDGSVPIDLGKAALPALQHAELLFGSPKYGNTCSVRALGKILAGKGLPKLTYLGLKNSEWERELIAAVARSAILPRLHTLDLGMGILHTEGAEALLAHAAKFRHLEKLDLDDNYLTGEHARAIKKAIPCAHLGSQREPPDDDDRVPSFTGESE
jgi:hypothetical protein